MVKMRILVDADACPGKDVIEKVAKSFQIPVLMFSDDAHLLRSEYSELRVVEQGREQVDYALLLATTEDDIVITQDIGLAAMVLGKGSAALNPHGKLYNPATIDYQLAVRAAAAKQRRRGKYGKGPKKRKTEDDTALRTALIRVIERHKGETH